MIEFVYFRHINNFSPIIMSLRMLQLSLLSHKKLMSDYVRSLASMLYNPLQTYFCLTDRIMSIMEVYD